MVNWKNEMNKLMLDWPSEDALSVWMNLSKHSLFVSSIKTDYLLVCNLKNAQEKAIGPEG